MVKQTKSIAKNTTEKEFKIIQAFDAIVRAAHNSFGNDDEDEKKDIPKKDLGFDGRQMKKVEDEMDFLTAKLSLTKMQVLILGMLIDRDGALASANMAHYLGMSNLEFLANQSELDDLIARRLVRNFVDRNERSAYLIRAEVMKSYLNNQVYKAENYKNLSLPDFLNTFDRLMGLSLDDAITNAELEQEITLLLNNNRELFLCKPILGFKYPEQLFFLICAWKYAYYNDKEVELFEVFQLVNQLKLGRMQNELKNKRSPLLKDKLLEEGGRDSKMRVRGVYSVSSEYRDRLKTELNLDFDDDDKCSDLKSFKDIKEKKLYFNPDEEKYLSELKSLMDHEKFQDIQRRLSEYGMRKGFACLFYGAPGTGKTESVLQLARMSGRDIMEVNITDIKSKWVGDSEKNIKDIFNRYRFLCEKSDRCPILLFNEADAVFGVRNENVRRSVDHMENAIQNIILEEMEKLDGILIATTNMATNLDKAFERRFLYKIEFTKPDLEARAHIWSDMIPELSEGDANVLAGKYSFSGGQIENIARKQIVNRILRNEDITLNRLQSYCDSETISDTRRTVVGFK